MIKMMRFVFAAVLLISGVVNASTFERATAGSFTTPTAGVMPAVSLAGGSIAVTNNKIIVLYISQNDVRTVSSIADDGTTSFARIGASGATGGGGTADIWEGTVTATNAGQNVIVTLSGTHSDNSMVIVMEVSGLLADQSTATTGNNTQDATMSHVSASVSPPGTTDFAVAGAIRGNATWTDDVNYTEISTGTDNVYVGYRVNPSGAQQLSYSSDIARSSVIKLSILAGSAGGSAVPAKFRHYRQMKQ